MIKNQYQCLAYNICKDHVHILLLSYTDQLSKMIQKIKSVSSKNFNRSLEVNQEKVKYHNRRLWSQKYFVTTFEVDKLQILSNEPAQLYHSKHIENTIHYIENNRIKHDLPLSAELTAAIAKFVKPNEYFL